MSRKPWQPPPPETVLECATALTIPPRVTLDTSIREIRSQLDRAEDAARTLRGRDGYTELMHDIGVMQRYLGAVEQARVGLERCSAQLQESTHRVLADSPDAATHLRHKQAIELDRMWCDPPERMRHEKGTRGSQDSVGLASTAFPVSATRATHPHPAPAQTAPDLNAQHRPPRAAQRRAVAHHAQVPTRSG